MTSAGMRVLDYPGRGIRLELDVGTPRDVRDADAQRELARLALDGVFTFFAGLGEPLAMDLWISCNDIEFDHPLGNPEPDSPFWFARCRDLPDRVAEPAWENARVVMVDQLTEESAMAVVSGALGQDCQDCGPGEMTGWREMLFRSVRVRLPEDVAVPAGGRLPVRVGRGSVACPVERRGGTMWVCPPVLYAPFEVMVTKCLGVMSLDVALLWSVWAWADDGIAGRRSVMRAVGELTDHGWRTGGAEAE